MNDLFPWILVLILLAAAYPWAHWLLARSPQPERGWLSLLLALALAVGALALTMFWQALVGIRLTLWSITLVYGLLMLPGWVLNRGFGWTLPRSWRPDGWPVRIALLLLGIISTGILFNSLYWPFSRDDALAIYAHWAAYMTEHRALAELQGAFTVYEAYPILIPLTYTYAYLAAGWQHEFLARLFPALLSLGCLPAVFILGRSLHSVLAGWIAALLLALTPSFVSWASSGYVDLPMAFFYTLAAVFAWRLWQHNHWTDALITGALMGLAAWTKNAALLGVVFLTLWLIWGGLRRRIGWRSAALTLLVCASVGAPWYLRNWLEAGLIIPPTVWAEQSQQNLETLFILVTRPQNYGLTGLLTLLALLSVGVNSLRQRQIKPESVLLLLWTVPFFGAWWLFASYDPRFVLLFLPLLCVLAGQAIAQLWMRIPAHWQPRLTAAALLLAVLLAAPVIWDSVEFKNDLLRQPIMSADMRRAIVLAERQPRLFEQMSRPEAEADR
jgi:4-amino-4-deoxy-L-arabinose transferase-like glycosyltransferase